MSSSDGEIQNQTNQAQGEALEQIAIRPLKVEDLPFLYSTWLKSYKNSRFAKRIKNDVYFMRHHMLIDELLQRPSNRTYVAHLRGEEDVIFGYLVSEIMSAEAKIIHYCFVKDSFRSHGIAKMLLRHASITSKALFSHWTFMFDAIFEKYQNQLTYDPYKA